MSLLLLPHVKTDVNYFDFAPKDIPEVDGMLEYSDRFGNGGNFNAFIIETDPKGLEDPEVINGIYNMEELMRTKGVTVTSIADSLKDINDIISRSSILEKLANLTDADNIIFDKIAKEGIVNSDHSKTLILVTIPIGLSIQETETIVNELNQIADSTILPHNGHVSRITGQDAVNVAVNNKLFDEQARSMIIAILLVLAALIVIFNSTTYGFLTMIPVFFLLMWEPGFLAGTNISLSPVTITIASIMIGIGIDYGVHITHRFREEIAKGLSKIESTKIAIEKTGLSLVEAATTTVFGMASLFIIGITAINEFVIIIIFMTSMSCIAAALILPVLFDIKYVK
jgi:predicted RND superfamily exporter protein